ncbi:DUF1850 domain-containing protein [Testudinibacter aquarius]|uniref:DUF1850 domain-containing protein n=1 Tax=Testudinibacter aquarius TaxID=1524974 RepID=A0A4R3Y0E3_9PAST|nr:DUF1850 domain-containing protein [Testudinibacter aquarius]KAE9527832.1 hypothetical protein A1D24_10765 [Testudinibacter aquarius]TCV84882.1 hypothetical protein EDC16_110114 [Testudinibacter aquarius]TNG90594.1 DUF1850 domain-containing protein [Testudinibacter aquarius]
MQTVITGKGTKILLLILTALACFLPLKKVFWVSAAERQCYLDSPDFELRWRHSVEHQWWREHYRRDGEGILLDQTLFQTFGAGTPSQGELLSTTHDYVGYRQHIYLHEINWAVSNNMQGSLSTQRQDIPLYQLVPDYTVVRIEPSRIAFIDFLWGMSCYDWAS